MIDFYLSLPETLEYEDLYTIACKNKQGSPLKQFILARDYAVLFKAGFHKNLEEKMPEYKYFNIIPADDFLGHVYGMVCRFPDGSFHSKRYSHFCMFGLDSFRDITKNDPIIVIEGIKDCMVIKEVYPYCVATLTAFIPYLYVIILKKITNNVIMFKDNDSTGKKVSNRLEWKHNIRVYGSYGNKDFGEYWSLKNKLDKQAVLDYIKIIVETNKTDFLVESFLGNQ